MISPDWPPWRSSEGWVQELQLTRTEMEETWRNLISDDGHAEHRYTAECIAVLGDFFKAVLVGDPGVTDINKREVELTPERSHIQQREEEGNLQADPDHRHRGQRSLSQSLQRSKELPGSFYSAENNVSFITDAKYSAWIMFIDSCYFSDWLPADYIQTFR